MRSSYATSYVRLVLTVLCIAPFPRYDGLLAGGKIFRCLQGVSLFNALLNLRLRNFALIN